MSNFVRENVLAKVYLARYFIISQRKDKCLLHAVSGFVVGVELSFLTSARYQIFNILLLITYLRTYLPTYLTSYLPYNLPTYLITYLPTDLPTYIPIKPPIHPPTYQPSYYLSISLSIYILVPKIIIIKKKVLSRMYIL